MALENRYYEVVEPFFHFQKVGWAESNTYIGASMALTSVHESRNAEPGAQIHSLVGGLFLVDGDEVHEIALRTSKSILEKSYLHRPDSEFLDAMVESGALRRIDEPVKNVAYGAARKGGRQFPKHTGQVIWIDHSQAFEEMKMAFPDLMAAVANEEGWKAEISDVGLERDVTVSLSKDGNRVARFVADTVTGKGYLMTFRSAFDGTALWQSLAEALPEGAVLEDTGDRLTFAKGFMRHLPVIQSHLAQAVEEIAVREATTAAP